MFKVNNKDTGMTQLAGVFLVSLLLFVVSLNIFHTLFLVFLLLTLNIKIGD